MRHQPFVSVVVCTYNGANHLAETLTALTKQSYPQSSLEIIVIDDGSTDDTANIAAQFNVQLVAHGHNRGLGVGRNSGITAARGEIIAFTDDDCLPDSNWLESLILPYSDATVMATGGKTVAVSSDTPTERYMDLSGYGNPAPLGISGGPALSSRFATYIRQMVTPLHTLVKDQQDLQEIFTLNASCRTAMLREIGGFDVRLRAAEDSDVSVRLNAKFPLHHIVFASQAHVAHRHRRQLWPWIAQTFERSQDAYLQIRKENRLPPIFPFPIFAVLLSLAALTHGHLVALITLLVAPLVLYWWWQIRLAGKPLLDRLRFPYMQFFLEGATLSGYAVAFLRRRS